MAIRPIRNDDDLTAALKAVEDLWNALPGSPEADELDVLVILISAYENEHYPIPQADPIDVIRAVMQERGAKQKDLAEVLGSKSRTSEVLSRKRPLSLPMIRALSREWNIPPALLIREYALAA